MLTSEANLQARQTFMADHSCRNTQRLKVVNYFSRKAPPQMFVWAVSILNVTYPSKNVHQHQEMVPGLAHTKYFKKQHIVKKKWMNKKQQTYLPNTAHLSNQIWSVGIKNAARIIQKLILPQTMSYNKHDQ